MDILDARHSCMSDCCTGIPGRRGCNAKFGRKSKVRNKIWNAGTRCGKESTIRLKIFENERNRFEDQPRVRTAFVDRKERAAKKSQEHAGKTAASLQVANEFGWHGGPQKTCSPLAMLGQPVLKQRYDMLWRRGNNVPAEGKGSNETGLNWWIDSKPQNGRFTLGLQGI